MGRPRFKSRKDRRQSFRLTRNGFRVRSDGRLLLAKIGEVRVRWSRSLPSRPSSVTIIREPDGHYYASFVVDVPPCPLLVATREQGSIGIMRLATIATTDGKCWDVPNPRHLERTLRKLRRLERQKSRRQKGSKNRDKTRRKIAIQHGAVARARRDYHHKQALALVRENQVIHVEDLNIVGLVRNRRLARVIYDEVGGSSGGSLGKARSMGGPIRSLAGWHPARPFGCGHQLAKLALHVREWTCPTRGTEHDRDRNAAEVILAAGRAERLNACNTNGPGRGSGLGGARLVLQPRRLRTMKQEAHRKWHSATGIPVTHEGEHVKCK